MPGVVGGSAIQLDVELPAFGPHSVTRYVQVDRQQPSRADQEVVGEQGIHPSDRSTSRPAEPIPHSRLNVAFVAHGAPTPLPCATLTAPGSRVTSIGTWPKGSPSRWTRVLDVPSMRTVRACTISTFGLRRCLAW